MGSQVSGWELVNEGGALKLRLSTKVKTFRLGLELFKILSELAEAEGIELVFASLSD